MKRLLWAIPLLLVANFAYAQSGQGGNTTGLVIANCGTVSPAFAAGRPGPFTLNTSGQVCFTGTVTTTPSGTQNVNLTQILGAAPSLTNPLWVFPATGATFPVSGTFWQATQPVSGTVAVTQSTSPWVVSNGGTFPVQATLSAETTKVIGTVNQGTSPWVVSGAVTNAGTFPTQPASATAPISTMNSASANAGLNAAMAGVFDDASPTAVTENNFGFMRMSANRNVYTTLRDAAGNERGVNVSAGNALLVDASATTQPISAAALPLPSGAATSAAQTTMATNQTSGGQKTQITDSSGNAAVVTAASTASPATDRSVSVTLNAGSNGLLTTGTAGSPGAQVVTMQGIASMTPVLNKLAPSSASVDGITPVASGSAGASLVLKASAGNFYSGSAVNTTATAGFCLIVNSTSAPTTGSAVTPLMFAVLPANGSCSLGMDSGIPSVFSTGITFLVSSNASPFTFTSGTITAAISGKVS
jgi:hypothetical protein